MIFHYDILAIILSYTITLCLPLFLSIFIGIYGFVAPLFFIHKQHLNIYYYIGTSIFILLGLSLGIFISLSYLSSNILMENSDLQYDIDIGRFLMVQITFIVSGVFAFTSGFLGIFLTYLINYFLFKKKPFNNVTKISSLNIID